MRKKLLKMLDVEPEEYGPVTLLLVISFLMGLFLATFTVASQSFFLNDFAEATDLPVAVALSGAVGVVLTSLYNTLEGRIPFVVLGAGNLIILILLTAVVEYGDPVVIAMGYPVKYLYYFGF